MVAPEEENQDADALSREKHKFAASSRGLMICKTLPPVSVLVIHTCTCTVIRFPVSNPSYAAAEPQPLRPLMV